MALQAQIGSRFGANLAVRLVAGRATESGRAADLVRVGDILLLHHVFMAAIADMRRDRA